jgi:WD40 repeat protein
MGCGASTEEGANPGGNPTTNTNYDDEDEYDSDDDDRMDIQERTAKGEILNEDGSPMADDESDFVHSTLKKNTPPWLGAIVEPTEAPANNPAPPDQKLALEWVYGYRCDDGFNNLGVDSKGRVVYPGAAVIVCYDQKAHTQVHNTEHNDDVLCFSTCEGNPDLFASGQNSTINKVAGTRRSQDPMCVVWNTATNEKVTIKHSNKKATRVVALSRDGKYVACVGYDQPGTVNIFDAGTGAKLASESGDQLPNKINTLIWGPGNTFVTIGIKHVFTWTFDGGLTKKRAQMGGLDMQSFYTGAYLDAKSESFAVGAKSGDVYIFEQQADGNFKASRKVKAHKKTVTAMLRLKDGNILTAGKDKLIKQWGADFGESSANVSVASYARSLAEGPNGFHAGLREGQIVHFASGCSGSPNTIVDCHWDGELWGIACDPNNKAQFTTAGEDNTIITWDKNAHKVVSRGEFSKEKGKRRRRTRASTTSAHGVNHCARSVAFSSDSSTIALGTNDGKVSILDAKFNVTKVVNLNKYAKQKVRNKKDNWIQAMAFSPDNKCLAVGTHGSVICLLDVADDYKVGKVLDRGHNASISNLDWSKDSTAIQSNCIAYELLFHNIDTSNLDASATNPKSSEFKDVEWATQKCKMGWPVRGIWEDGMDGSDINNCDRSVDGSLIASADDWGRVNLYRYPVGDDNEKTSYDNAHSSHVVDVRFTLDGQHLLSTGGNDKCILQWKLN